ncbi:hypothetical protein L3N51_01406 [Metallosphaera sp. J1]|nr:hypothetical protein [Metallosphaera javensis (ex Hofmann et al. 2022)]
MHVSEKLSTGTRVVSYPALKGEVFRIFILESFVLNQSFYQFVKVILELRILRQISEKNIHRLDNLDYLLLMFLYL